MKKKDGMASKRRDYSAPVKKLFGCCRSLQRFFAGLLLASALICASNQASAATNDWVFSNGSASWFLPVNWSAGVPAAGDEVFIANGTTAFVQGTNAATAADLFINTGGVTIGNISPGSLAVGGQIAIGTEGTPASLALDNGSLSANNIVVGLTGSYTDTTNGTLTLTGINPTIQLANGVNMVVNGEILGTNGLVETGSGTLTLLNSSNAYTGGTTISAGTLQVGNGGVTGALGGGDVADNGTLVFDRGDSITVSNLISGTGALVQAGSGTLTLTGDNTYGGTTTISNGTLQIGNGGTTGSLGTGDVSDNGVLTFDRSDNITVSNLISGTGALNQIGGGTLTLTANNTYGGTTTISSNGTLQVGNGGTTGSLGTGDVSDNGTLSFDRSDSVTVSNLISGTGALVQAGSGTLILAADNSYAGVTTISNGTLQVGNGATSGSLGTNEVVNDGTLVFDRADEIVINNVISGTGSLVQMGTNSLILTASNTYSGGTSVQNGGTLTLFNGSALGSGDLNVVNGTVQAYSFLPSGLAMNVGGNYTQGAAGTLELRLGGNTLTNYDQLNVNGAANINGTLQLVSFNGYVPQHNDQQILLVANGGVAGTFSSVSNEIGHSALLNPQLFYDPNDITLKWQQLSFVSFLAASNGIKMTANQSAVAHAVDSIVGSTAPNDVALVNALDYVPDPTNELAAAFDVISPAQLTSMQVASFANMDAQGNEFLNRASELRTDLPQMYKSRFISQMPPGERLSPDFDQIVSNSWNLYAEVPIGFVGVNGDANADGYNITSHGVDVGADSLLNQHTYVGGSIGYANSGAGLDGGGSVDVDTLNLQGYAVWFAGGAYVEGMIGGNLNSYSTKREAIQGVADGKTDGTGLTGLLSGGYDWRYGPWQLGPQLTVQYMMTSINDFTETGSISPLHIQSQNQDAMHSILGLNLRYNWFVSDSWTIITPEADLGWRHDWMGNDLSINSQFASGAGNTFTVNGPDMGSDSMAASLGVNMQWQSSLSTYINYSFDVGRTAYNMQSFTMGLRLSF
jgi:outer membrane autotransporter protein